MMQALVRGLVQELEVELVQWLGKQLVRVRSFVKVMVADNYPLLAV